MDLPDLDRFRTRGNGELPTSNPRRKRVARKRRDWFVLGPIPGDWIGRAAALRGQCLHVALAVWHCAKLERSDCGKLTAAVLRKFGVNADNGRKRLADLEAAGLVTVERHPGRCPLVTICAGPRHRL